ncbi:MAG: hypothetical protein K6G12_04085 [Lachnospiraceae bacterium]|nr:hypothetical protein [Lachnospiraceae bacterium]
MTLIKNKMSDITDSLMGEMSEDIGAFREQLLDMVSKYDELIGYCDNYIGKLGKGRKSLVKKVRKLAIKERKCFANLGSNLFPKSSWLKTPKMWIPKKRRRESGISGI